MEDRAVRFALFCHSLISDWNHGNAHFLRGVATELIARGHSVRVFEPQDSWSASHLLRRYGQASVDEFERAYPLLRSRRYRELDLDEALDGIDVVIVHEWNDPQLVARIGKYRALRRDFRLFFHDTHHRAVTAPDELANYDLGHYDGVLAFGRVVRDIYIEHCWAQRAWTWHEAADVRVFAPRRRQRNQGSLVWVGNWGDEERSAELREFLLEPVAALRVPARIYGVRYPTAARRELARSGCEYGGWLPNYRVPDVFARFRVTVHVPRRPYATVLPGIPTIRPFEALACGIPLVCSPWEDSENLFRAGLDYLVAGTGEQMRSHLRAILSDRELAASLAAHGRHTILERHTCSHRVDELLAICRGLGVGQRPMQPLVQGPVPPSTPPSTPPSVLGRRAG
jgi:spore maturation protein CgeB